MPWRCPACSTQIRHNDEDPVPRPRVMYRCHVCRLELVVDERTQKLVVPPFETDERPKGRTPTDPFAT